MAKLPLEGFVVIDCSTVLAGPLAATHLADFGADVIKVELPGQPGGLTALRLHEERNKRSITIDLRKERGQELLLQLAEKADALIENFRPGTFEKWNLAPERLLERNPRLIVHRLSAYGQTGPWRERGAYDRQAQAVSGATYATGFPDSEPVRSGFATADYIAGIWGAFSIILAAYWRDTRDGTGQVSDLALFEPILRSTEASITNYSLNGVIRERAGNHNPGVVPGSNFKTADGITVAINANNDRQWARLARAIGKPELAEAPEYRMPARLEKVDEIYALLSAWVGARTYDEVDAALAEAAVPCAPVLNAKQIAEHPMFRERGSLVDVPVDGREVTMVAPLPHFSATPGQIRHAGPVPGAHTEEILRDFLGLNEEQIADLRREGVIGKEGG